MDRFTSEKRSENMRKINSSNTRPELLVRNLCRQVGIFGYRFNAQNIVGRPDIVWTRRKRAIFVNGCFWHGHTCKEGNRVPKTNRKYWRNKITSNIIRDKRVKRVLNNEGWKVITIWECQINEIDKLIVRINRLHT